MIPGSPDGLTATGGSFWTQDSAGIAEEAGGGDLFGYSLAGGDYDGDGYDDLAIGAWRELVGAIDHAGAVNVIYGSGTGLTSAGDQVWHQDVEGAADIAEGHDLFGYSLASGNFGAGPEDDLAIGIPKEDVPTYNGGAAQVVYGSSSGLAPAGNELWQQDSDGLADDAEDLDLLGYAVSALTTDRAHLVLGSPFEDVGSVADAGAAHVLVSEAGELETSSLFWHQGVDGVEDEPHAGDKLGLSSTFATPSCPRCD